MNHFEYNENVTRETLNKLCQILHSQENDIAEITFNEKEDLYYKELLSKPS